MNVFTEHLTQTIDTNKTYELQFYGHPGFSIWFTGKEIKILMKYIEKALNETGNDGTDSR